MFHHHHPPPPPPILARILNVEILINCFFSNNFVKSLLVDNSKLLQKLYLVKVWKDIRKFDMEFPV